MTKNIKQPAVSASIPRKRILVADDDPVVREALSRLLAMNSSLEVCDEAVDGQDAVIKAEQHRPDLIILDLSMQILNGLEAAAEITKILPGVRIILFSAYGKRLDDIDITAYGITKVVSKDDDLLGEVAELLDTADADAAPTRSPTISKKQKRPKKS
jgi:DNA-binding NarL/FixJ family response regulator